MSALTALELRELSKTLKAFFEKEYLDKVYPVGSIYISVSATHPSVFFGGTWKQLKNRFLLGAGDTYVAGTIGGSADAVLIEHNHEIPTRGGISASDINGGYGAIVETASDFTNNAKQTTTAGAPTGENGKGKNMPPYIAVYMWQRTA